MSSSATSGLSAGSLARRARVFTIGLLLCGLLGAAGLAFAGYRAQQVNAAVRNYAPAASLYRARTAAIHQLGDMETAFHRFLLDGNSVNLSLMERDKESIEQLAQQDPEVRGDKLLQDIVAKEQQWYSQAAQPLIEQRKSAPAGQGVNEDFLTRYHSMSPDLGVISFEIAADRDFRNSIDGLAQAQRVTSFWFLVFCLTAALVLIVFLFALTSASLKHVSGLQKAGSGSV